MWQMALHDLVVVWISQPGKGNGKCSADLPRVKEEGIRPFKEADDWGDDVIGHRMEIVHLPKNADIAGVQTDFFLCLAQGRRDDVGVRGVHAPAGKRDLPGVAIIFVLRPANEEEMPRSGDAGERDQDRGGAWGGVEKCLGKGVERSATGDPIQQVGDFGFGKGGEGHGANGLFRSVRLVIGVCAIQAVQVLHGAGENQKSCVGDHPIHGAETGVIIFVVPQHDFTNVHEGEVVRV